MTTLTPADPGIFNARKVDEIGVLINEVGCSVPEQNELLQILYEVYTSGGKYMNTRSPRLRDQLRQRIEATIDGMPTGVQRMNRQRAEETLYRLFTICRPWFHAQDNGTPLPAGFQPIWTPRPSAPKGAASGQEVTAPGPKVAWPSKGAPSPDTPWLVPSSRWVMWNPKVTFIQTKEPQNRYDTTLTPFLREPRNAQTTIDMEWVALNGIDFSRMAQVLIENGFLRPGQSIWWCKKPTTTDDQVKIEHDLQWAFTVWESYQDHAQAWAGPRPDNRWTRPTGAKPRFYVIIKDEADNESEGAEETMGTAKTGAKRSRKNEETEKEMSYTRRRPWEI